MTQNPVVRQPAKVWGLTAPPWSRIGYLGLTLFAILAGLFFVGLTGAEENGLFALPIPGLVLGGLFSLIAAWRSGKRIRQLEAEPAREAIEEDVVAVRAERITAALSSYDDPLTVEAIEHNLGWTEVAVVTGLRSLVDQGNVVEDLDLESGLWTYRLVGDGPVGSPPPRTALSIHDREAALVRQREEIEAEEAEAQEEPA